MMLRNAAFAALLAVLASPTLAFTVPSHIRPTASLKSTQTDLKSPLDYLDPLGVKPKPPGAPKSSAAIVPVEPLPDTLIPGPLNTWPNTKRDVPFEVNWNGEKRKDKVAAATQRKTYDGYELPNRVTIY